jgi:hypothetical protein
MMERAEKKKKEAGMDEGSASAVKNEVTNE